MSAISTGIFVASLIFTYHTPPKGISISLKFSTSIILLFRQVNKITRKYQTKEADVQSGYELLKWMEKKMLKSIYSEKATKFCEISTVDLSYVVTVKSTVEISQNFAAFWEYMNFTANAESLLKL